MGESDGSNGRLRLTGAEALARTLRASGVTQIFGVAGGRLMSFMSAIARDDALRYIGTRHEAAGAFMAAGHFQATGRVAVCFGEIGAGAHNLIGGVGTAYNNNLALLALTSNNPTRVTYPFHGMFMDVDAERLFAATTKWNAVVRDPQRVPELVRRALREALTGRPGPVHLDLPADVLFAVTEYDADALDIPLECYLPAGRANADPGEVERAAEQLARAERPLLIAGGGVARSEAEAEFRELTAELGAAATATQMGLGVVPTTSPDFIGHGGIIGGDAVLRAMEEADVVLSVGCRFSSWLWKGGEPFVRGWPEQQLIQVDADPAMIGRLRPVSIGLQGDARAVLAQILAALDGRLPAASAEWLASLVETYAAYRAGLAELASDAGEVMHPATLAREIAEFLPADSLVVYDGGHTTFWSNDLTPATEPRTRFHEPGMAQLGFGGPYALALKAAFPDRPVFNVTGDGSFGFTIQELDTARRYGLNAVHVIHDNAAWGIIRAGQKQLYGFELGATLEGTDYAAIARGFGCHGERVRRAADVQPALQRALDSGLPAVVDVEVRFEPHPTHRVFGAMGFAGIEQPAPPVEARAG